MDSSDHAPEAAQAQSSLSSSDEQAVAGRIFEFAENWSRPTAVPVSPEAWELFPEVQNILRVARESVDGAVTVARLTHRVLRQKDGKDSRGAYAAVAQNSLRAALNFAGAGLDAGLKRLVEDALPRLIAFDEQTAEKLSSFAEKRITATNGGVSATSLVELLIHHGSNPRDILLDKWSNDLRANSAQSVERVDEIAMALGVDSPEIRKRANPTTKSLLLRTAFRERNKIAHELDVSKPRGESREAMERIETRRSADDISKWAWEMLDVAQLVVNDVAVRIEKNEQP